MAGAATEGYIIKEIGEDGKELKAETLKDAIAFAESLADLGKPQLIVNAQNGVEVYATTDDPELKKYESYDYEEWSNVGKGHHKDQTEPSVYFDIDGTLGKWYSDGRGLTYEEIINPENHYFRDIEPHDGVIKLANNLQNKDVDVCIISAADKNTIRDKWQWIDEHLPFIPKENICFSPIGADKSQFVKGNAEKSMLIDDYNKNLDEWKGYSVKLLNGINHYNPDHEFIDITSRNYDYTQTADQLKLELTISLHSPALSSAHKGEEYNNRIDYGIAERSADMDERKTLAEVSEMFRSDMENGYGDYAGQRYENWMDDRAELESELKEQGYSEDDIDKYIRISFNEEGKMEILDIRKEQNDWIAEYISDKNYTATEYLTDEIEQYLYDRGEYDYPDADVPFVERGLETSEENRMATARNISDMIENNARPLANYLSDELDVLSRYDELRDKAAMLYVRMNELDVEQNLDKYFRDGMDMAGLTVEKTGDNEYCLALNGLDIYVPEFENEPFTSAVDLPIEITGNILEDLEDEFDQYPADGRVMNETPTTADEWVAYGKNEQNAASKFVRDHQMEFNVLDVVCNKIKEVDIEKAYPGLEVAEKKPKSDIDRD